MARKQPKIKQPKIKQPKIDVKVHQRILRFVNAARRPEDLMWPPQKEIPLIDNKVMHGVRAHEAQHGVHEAPAKELKRGPLLKIELAKRVLEERERISPIYGFHHIRQLLEIKGLVARNLLTMLPVFSRAVKGEWEVLYTGLVPSETPIDIAHAALLHTNRVLFIPESFSSRETLLWNPDDGDPTTAFRLLDGPTTGLTGVLFCGGHSFLSDGKLLVVGGGTSSAGTVEAWKFDPDPAAETWTQTAGNLSPGDGDMEFLRWYPTTLTLGDDSGRVLVVDGRPSQMEIYDESTDSFSRVWGPGGEGDTSADRSFPQLYPGLHLLRNGEVFFTRTGNNNGTDPAAYFTFSSRTTGQWTELTGVGVGEDRGRGMSVMLLGQQPADPDRIMVFGGGDAATGATAGLIDVPPSASPWLSGDFPDEERRRSVNAVLLPDGTVFVSGGRPAGGTPVNGGACWLYDPSAGLGAGAWSEMDELTDARQYHSVALLLPSGKVMTTGGSSQRIEVFSPPYLFNPDGTDATRPDITSFPDPDAGQIVLHGSTFEIGTANPCDISSVVMVRPMAVTHQTDTEQKVIQLSFTPGTTTLSVTAPDGRVYPYGAGGGHTHAIAGRGYYMLFILNTAGVPSEAKFIRLV